MHYIGIDGGGTKTLFALYDATGTCLAQLCLPSCHYLQVGPEKMKAILECGIDALKKQTCEPVAIGLGLAGYGQNQELVQKIDEVLMLTLKEHPYVVTSDARIALSGALHDAPGMLVIAGTGSIMLATDGKKDYRVGGWGALLGDEGSAYWLARRVLSLFTQQADGRLARTPLYELIHHGEGLDQDSALITRLKTGERERIAGFARYVYAGAKKADPYCLALYEKAGKFLANGLNALSQHLSGEVISASYAGGVFQAGAYIMEPLKKSLNCRIQLIDPLDGPAYGAYLLIKKKMEGANQK